MKRYIKIGMENKNNDISNKLLTMMIMLEIGSVLSVRSSGLEFSSVDMLFLSVVRVQKLFFWRPKNIANPKPSFFSFKSFIENPKMKVSIMILYTSTERYMQAFSYTKCILFHWYLTHLML